MLEPVARASWRHSRLARPGRASHLGRAPMAHLLAKLILEQAGTFVDRCEAAGIASRLGMPLRAIEDYLDWVENTADRSPTPPVETQKNAREIAEKIEARLLRRPGHGSAA